MITPSLTLAGILGLGGPELIIILVIMMVLFGGSKLPELAKGLGKSIKEFKRASTEDSVPAVSERAVPTDAAGESGQDGVLPDTPTAVAVPVGAARPSLAVAVCGGQTDAAPPIPALTTRGGPSQST